MNSKNTQSLTKDRYLHSQMNTYLNNKVTYRAIFSGHKKIHKKARKIKVDKKKIFSNFLKDNPIRKKINRNEMSISRKYY